MNSIKSLDFDKLYTIKKADHYFHVFESWNSSKDDKNTLKKVKKDFLR